MDIEQQIFEENVTASGAFIQPCLASNTGISRISKEKKLRIQADVMIERFKRNGKIK